MPKANPYIVTLKTPDGPREVRTRAWNVVDAVTQSCLEVSNDYAQGAEIGLVKVVPDESLTLDGVLAAAVGNKP